MKPDRNYTRNSNPSRWDSADPDTVTRLAEHGINADLAALNDWFYQCKRQYPSIFRGWTVEQFKNWNDKRIAELELQPPAQIYDQALAEIKGNCLKQI